MKLVGADGETFELLVEGYQFPDHVTGGGDSDWLMVRCRVRHPRGDWDSLDPCLTASEVGTLAAWFEAIAGGRLTLSDLFFTEPNLCFRYSAEPSPTVTVGFAYESAPPWVTDPHERRDGIAVSFPLATNDAGEAAASLLDLLLAFPSRRVFALEMESA